MGPVGPRLFGVPAARAPVVAVLRRGPSDWSHVGRWDVARGTYEPGAWIHGHIYPQRCDVSPDGRWLCYFTLKASARWPTGGTYVAISRLPWLTALAAWSTCGTWTRGLHFVDDPRVWQVEAPDAGDAAPCQAALGLAFTRPVVFAVERRRGWTETADSPPANPADMWDEQRAPEVTMEKRRPAVGSSRLLVRGYFAAFREGEPGPISYAVVEDGGATVPLDGVQWADWDAEGRLLAATTDGKLQIREGWMTTATVLSEVDLAALRPQPAPPPEEAHRW